MSGPLEKIDYWQSSVLKEIELSRAQFTHFGFEKHVDLDYHIGVVCRGGLRYHHKGSEYRLTSGNLSTLNPDESHNDQSISNTDYEALVMSLPTSYVKKVGDALNQSELFYRHGHLHNLPENRTTLSNQQLDRIKQQFLEGLEQEFDLEQLALSVGLSKFQFLRQFKGATGMTPHAYLKRFRLECAKKALMRAGSAINTAFELGFFDQSHFNKAFKRAFLTTPAHFQKRVTP